MTFSKSEGLLGLLKIGVPIIQAPMTGVSSPDMAAAVAQGYEAGGHRGVFDPTAGYDRLGTLALTRLLVRNLDVPVIAAGGIMDGAGIVAALRLGAGAAQLGTAFVTTDESLADAGYRTAMRSDAAHHTVMTSVISGRPARCLANRFTALGAEIDFADVPSYPLDYDAGKALNAAGKAVGNLGMAPSGPGRAHRWPDPFLPLP